MDRMAYADGRPREGGGLAAPPADLIVIAAAIIEQGRLLVVSKKSAPDIFCLPGGKPGPGETARETLIRELGEELGAWPAGLTLLGQFDGPAALGHVPMRMTVFAATLGGVPGPRAEVAALGWTTGSDEYEPRLAPAVAAQVIPFLRRTGRMGAG
jgi:ADP-ribose pyrophosphatase YjhB (NUDIX family)